MRSVMLGSLVSGRSALLVLVMTAGAGASEREVRGRVVDEVGKPVADAAVGFFWRANGSAWDRDGKAPDLSKEANVKAFWSHLGEMEPQSPKPVKTEA